MPGSRSGSWHDPDSCRVLRTGGRVKRRAATRRALCPVAGMIRRPGAGRLRCQGGDRLGGRLPGMGRGGGAGRRARVSGAGEAGQGSQPYLGARARACGARSHDDGLGAPGPPGCGRSVFQAVRRLPRAAGRRRPDRGLAEPAACVPHRLMMAPVPACLRCRCSPGSGHTMARASSPSSARMWQARRTILRASARAARLPSLRSFTAA